MKIAILDDHQNVALRSARLAAMDCVPRHCGVDRIPRAERHERIPTPFRPLLEAAKRATASRHTRVDGPAPIVGATSTGAPR
jgi:hypothetical protein